MVNVIKRMRKLKQLLNIRIGPGALILPKDVQRITLEFNKHIDGGHRGARKFWREMAPRIKYHNPAIPIHIIRHDDPEGPSILSIYRASKAASTQRTPVPPTSSTGTSTEASLSEIPPSHTIDMKQQPETHILGELIKATDAKMVVPSQEEIEELKEMEELRQRSEVDRARVKEELRVQRREEELLRLARGEAAAAA